MKQENKYQYCENFCPFHETIKELNKNPNIFFSCAKAKMPCEYIENIMKGQEVEE